MRDDLAMYYADLRANMAKHTKKVVKALGKHITLEMYEQSLPKLVDNLDANLFPCVTSKEHNFYLVTAYDITRNGFGNASNEKLISIDKEQSIAIVAI